MIICDENIETEQVLLLRSWRIKAHKIGLDIGRYGTADPQIIPLLQSLKHPTFVTWDSDFYHRRLVHPRYCIIQMVVSQSSIGKTLRRLLALREFKTRAARMGKVIQVFPDSIRFWEFKRQREQRISWKADA
jgi:hypothetical protein